MDIKFKLGNEEIDIGGDLQRLETTWALRNKQLLADRDIINLVQQEKSTSDRIRWISNEPKVFYDTAKALISSYPPRFRMPLSINFKPEEKTKMNKSERFALGIMRNLDKRAQDRGVGGGWLRELAHHVLSGWYAVFTHINRDGEDVEFRADLWDALTVYPEWDEDGLAKCIRAYEVSKQMAVSMVENFANRGLKFKFDVGLLGNEHNKVVNYWYRCSKKKVWNAIIIGDQIIKELKEEKNFNHIPIFVGGIGSPDQSSADWSTRFGESIIASNRNMQEYENEMISLMATITAETTYPNLISKTLTGAPAIKEEQMKGYGTVVPLKLTDQLEILKHASTPAEVGVLLSWVRQQRQKGSIPDVVYGGLSMELSGFAISQLMAAIKYKLAPYLNSMQYILSCVITEFLSQYKKGEYPKIVLSTTDPKALQRGQFFVEEFSTDDVPESLYVEVTIPITSAMDKTQQIMFSRQALEPPQLLSRESLWDEILDIQDSEQEYARIIQDETLEMPVVKQIMVIEQLREREKLYRFEGKIPEANVLKTYIMNLEMSIGMRQGIPLTPQSAGGVPPNVMPPEMGGMSPDMTRAAKGVPPSGLSRRPQTPEERAESKGRLGRLVSPTGQVLL